MAYVMMSFLLLRLLAVLARFLIAAIAARRVRCREDYFRQERACQQTICEPPDQNLAILGLKSVPGSLSDLRSARRRAMRTMHPDIGGSQQGAKSVNAAFCDIASKLRA